MYRICKYLLILLKQIYMFLKYVISIPLIINYDIYILKEVIFFNEFK